MSTHINITLDLEDNLIDLRVPINQSVKSLMIEIYDIYDLVKDRENYHIKVMNKDIVILENEMLNNYPLSNGDLIKLI